MSRLSTRSEAVASGQWSVVSWRAERKSLKGERNGDYRGPSTPRPDNYRAKRKRRACHESCAVAPLRMTPGLILLVASC